MESLLNKEMCDYGNCQLKNCKRKAGTVCRGHKIYMCYPCAIQFHLECDLKIKDNISYILWAKEIAGLSVINIKKINEEFKVQDHFDDCEASFTDIEEKFKQFESELRRYLLIKDPLKLEDMLQKCNKIIQIIEDSRAYKYSSQFQCMQIIKDKCIYRNENEY